MGKTYDAVVIGAGIMGCCTALELAERGLSVAVFEKGRLGAGPTGESSAIIRQHYSNELTARMALFSLRVFQQFEERYGSSCGFRNTGFIALAAESDRAGLQANIALQQSVGIDTRLLAADELLTLMPGLNTADAVAAAYEPGSGYADAYLTLSALAGAARGKGVEIRQNTPVTAIDIEGARVAGVRAGGDRMGADIVVNCAGAWGAQVGNLAGVMLPVRSCRVQVAVVERPTDMAGEHPVVVDFVNAAYFRADTGQTTIAGLVDPAEADDLVDPDRYDRQAGFAFSADIVERLTRRCPDFERARLAEGYASLYAVTPDWHPIIDELPAGSGHFVCTGFSGHGFKLGPAVGKMTADLITRQSNPEFDPAPFRLSRFEENETVSGSYDYSILG